MIDRILVVSENDPPAALSTALEAAGYQTAHSLAWPAAGGAQARWVLMDAAQANVLCQRPDQLETQLASLAHRLQILSQNAQAVSATLELSQVLNRLAQGAVKALGAQACLIALLDEAGTQLSAAAACGFEVPQLQAPAMLSLDEHLLARRVALGGESIIIGDVVGDARVPYLSPATAHGLRATLAVPLQGKSGPLGLIRVYSTAPDHFVPDDAAFLAAIAGQGSLAIENALAYQQLGNLDQMKSKFVLTATHELITRALHRADFLQTMIDDLLDLAAGKSTSSRAAEERVRVSLQDAVARVAKRFEVPAQEKNIQLAYHCEDEQAIAVSATPENIDRILNNLVSNAIKYTPPGGQVMITVRRARSYAHLKVVDTGIGIPEDSLPHLFEEFYRAPNAKSTESGTGLGLAITRDLVIHYGGRIGVISEGGQGTTFAVILPVITD